MNCPDAVDAVLTALNLSAIPFMVVGSFSSNIYGIERSTKDLDLVLELGDASIHRLARHFPPSIRLDPQMSFETMTLSRRYRATVEGTDFEIAFFLLGNDPFQIERFQRRRNIIRGDGLAVDYPTPEDVVIQTLRWGRSKDLDDARDVIAVQGDDVFDWDYIHAWCDRHGTRAKLDDIRRSIPPIE